MKGAFLDMFMELYEKQRAFDEVVAENRGIIADEMMPERYLALLVEIGEMANETRTFKFWSLKDPSPKEKIIDEAADCMHFIISIGNFTGRYYDFSEANTSGLEHLELTEVFIKMFESTVNYRNRKKDTYYFGICQYFMTAARKLGFSNKELRDAYNKKHLVNYNRQASGY